MSGSFTGFPIPNVAIPSLPDLGGVTDATMLVGERAGTGRIVVTALRDYVMGTVASSGYTTKTYVDAADATKLPLAGGVLTGNLTVKDTITFSSTGMSLFAGPTSSIWTMDSNNYDLIYNRSTGDLAYRRGGDNVELWGIHENGDNTVAGALTVAGNITTGAAVAASGSIAANGIVVAGTDAYARGGHYYFGADDGRKLSTDANGTVLQFWSDGWQLSWSRANASLTFFSNTLVPNFSVDANGNGLFHGTVHGSNVTLMETRIDELQAQVADLQAALTSLIEARQAEMATPRATD